MEELRSGRSIRARRMLRAVLWTAILLLPAACATSDPAYRSPARFNHREAARHAQPSLTVTRTDGGFSLRSPFLPGVTLSGLVEDGPEPTLFITEARLFANWPNGWTEAHYEASGVIRLRRAVPTPRDDRGRVRYSVEVSEPIELWTLLDGGIRYFDTYILYDEGVGRVRARVERLEALAGWLRNRTGRPFFGHPFEEGRYGPGLTGELRAQLQATFSGDTGGDGEPPPEWLSALYESGSIERDVREASWMLTALYNLEYVNEHVLNAIRVEARQKWN
jgi:hypothetical protein